MLKCVLLAALCFVGGSALEIKLQVDDIHVLFADGMTVSQGEWWSHTYTVTIPDPTFVVLYAENISGPKGFKASFNGGKSYPSDWKCQNVNSVNDISMGTINYADPAWTQAKWESGDWMWASQGGQKCMCWLNYQNPGDPGNGGSGGVVDMKLQVDDIHVLWSDGQKVSSGNAWSQVYSVSLTSPRFVLLYAENISGPKGFKASFNGGDSEPSDWKCKNVNNVNDVNPNNPNYADSSWKTAKVEYGEWMWASQGGGKIFCWTNYAVPGDPGNGGSAGDADMKLQVDDIHKLWSDGQQVSSGNIWSKVYSIFLTSPRFVLLYAENISGPKGFKASFNGGDSVPSDWKCKNVNNVNDVNPNNPNYADSSWKTAKVEYGDWMWASQGGGKIFCWTNYANPGSPY